MDKYTLKSGYIEERIVSISWSKKYMEGGNIRRRKSKVALTILPIQRGRSLSERGLCLHEHLGEWRIGLNIFWQPTESDARRRVQGTRSLAHYPHWTFFRTGLTGSRKLVKGRVKVICRRAANLEPFEPIVVYLSFLFNRSCLSGKIWS